MPVEFESELAKGRRELLLGRGLGAFCIAAGTIPATTKGTTRMGHEAAQFLKHSRGEPKPSVGPLRYRGSVRLVSFFVFLEGGDFHQGPLGVGAMYSF